MNWIFFALISPFLWSIVNLIDDNLLRKVYRSSTFGAVISGLFGAIPGLYLFIVNENLNISIKYISLGLIAGFLTVVFYYFYFRVLESEEPSVGIALLNLAPAFIPLLAKTFLNEQLNTAQYIGIFLIVTASLALSLTNIRKLRFSKVIIFAFFASINFAFISLISKYAYNAANFREIYMWISIGMGIGGLSFYFLGDRRQQIKSIIIKSKLKIILILVIAEIINILAEVSQGYAASIGPISIVRALEGIQPVYILLISFTVGIFIPKFFRETRDARLPKKIFFIILMIIGLLLIYSNTDI